MILESQGKDGINPNLFFSTQSLYIHIEYVELCAKNFLLEIIYYVVDLCPISSCP